MVKDIKITTMGILLFNAAYNEKHNCDSDIFIRTFPDVYSIARIAKIKWHYNGELPWE